MKRFLVLVVSVALLAADAKDDAVKKEVEKFQGSWTGVSLEAGGQKAPDEFAKQNKITFTGDKYVQTMGGQTVEAGTQKLDPTKKPKTMDISVTEGDMKGSTQLGIYEIEGDTLKICVAEHGSKDRPTEFATKAGSRNMLIVLKKDKAK
jgi:uncharacterized protein (TIGR03067 family)